MLEALLATSVVTVSGRWQEEMLVAITKQQERF
jgi:hypothetical protein